MSFESASLIMVNWSSMPIPSSHEFVNATLTLNRLSGGENQQETIRVAVCEVFDEWDQNATYNSPNGTNASYTNDGCDTPFSITTLDYQDTSVDFDITYAVQHAHARGDDKINLAFFVV